MPLRLVILVVLTTWGCLLIKSSSLDYELELELLQVLFRHGDRTPLESETYPTDPYKSDHIYEPYGRNQLTELGHYRMRRLGQALRRRYGAFLRTVSRSAGSIYAYSAKKETCLASLRLLIDGLRIVKGSITIRGQNTDILMNLRACSKYQTELKRIRRLPEVVKLLATYEGLYSYVAEKTGLSFEGIPKDERLHQLYNLLEAQRSMNLSLPNWCPEGVFNLFTEIAYLHFNLESYTDKLKKLNGGALVRHFLENMMRSGLGNSANIQLYSVEDHNVAAFTRAIDRRFPRLPDFGSAIILEKHRALSNAKTFVRIMIWTGVTEKLFPIRLSNCDEICLLEDFAKIVATSLPTNDNMRCLFNDSKDARRL